MSRTLRVVSRARADVDHIFDWLVHRSVRGAIAWYLALRGAVDQIAASPESFAEAPEAVPLDLPLAVAFQGPPRPHVPDHLRLHGCRDHPSACSWTRSDTAPAEGVAKGISAPVSQHSPRHIHAVSRGRPNQAPGRLGTSRGRLWTPRLPDAARHRIRSPVTRRDAQGSRRG